MEPEDLQQQHQFGAKNLIPYVAAGAAIGAAEERMLAGVGIRKGPWELFAPLVIFFCIVAAAIAWGSAALESDRSDPCYGNMNDPVCMERVDR